MPRHLCPTCHHPRCTCYSASTAITPIQPQPHPYSHTYYGPLRPLTTLEPSPLPPPGPGFPGLDMSIPITPPLDRPGMPMLRPVLLDRESGGEEVLVSPKTTVVWRERFRRPRRLVFPGFVNLEHTAVDRADEPGVAGLDPPARLLESIEAVLNEATPVQGDFVATPKGPLLPAGHRPDIEKTPAPSSISPALPSPQAWPAGLPITPDDERELSDGDAMSLCSSAGLSNSLAESPGHVTIQSSWIDYHSTSMTADDHDSRAHADGRLEHTSPIYDDSSSNEVIKSGDERVVSLAWPSPPAVFSPMELPLSRRRVKKAADGEGAGGGGEFDTAMLGSVQDGSESESDGSSGYESGDEM